MSDHQKAGNAASRGRSPNVPWARSNSHITMPSTRSAAAAPATSSSRRGDSAARSVAQALRSGGSITRMPPEKIGCVKSSRVSRSAVIETLATARSARPSSTAASMAGNVSWKTTS